MRRLSICDRWTVAAVLIVDDRDRIPALSVLSFCRTHPSRYETFAHWYTKVAPVRLCCG
jgi:hypothetical protein